MKPVEFDFTIHQGSTRRLRFHIASESDRSTPRDLTGYTARMQARKSVRAADPLFDLTTENGGIAFTDDNRVLVTVSAEVSAGLPAGTWPYDIDLMHGDVVETPLVGRVTVAAQISRPAP
jgi:hypothetical protein